MRLMTWNMQGAGTSGDATAKWDALAAHIAAAVVPFDGIALQECGTISDGVPGDVTLVDTIKANGWDVEIYEWTPPDGAGGRLSLFISHAWFDYGSKGKSGRVNLAIVTPDRPTRAETTLDEGRRPVVGIFLAAHDMWLFTIHCKSPFGQDAELLISNVWLAVGNENRFMIMGDFNKQPGDLAWNGEVLAEVRSRVDLVRRTSGALTLSRADPRFEVDYAVGWDDVDITTGTPRDMNLSDHFAVEFD